MSKIDTSDSITQFFYNSEIQYGEDDTAIYEDLQQNIWIVTKAKGLFKLNTNTSRFDKIPLQIKRETITSTYIIL